MRNIQKPMLQAKHLSGMASSMTRKAQPKRACPQHAHLQGQLEGLQRGAGDALRTSTNHCMFT